MPPTYTPASANAALPYVRRVVADLVRDHADWRASAAALAAVDAVPPADAVRAAGADVAALRRRAAQLAEDVRAALADLATLGVECKGLDVGLVDFPAVMAGVPAYLCWKLGEPTVAWWHPRDAGFAGRQLIGGAWSVDIAAPEVPA
ncbi:MAG TPA: DUF2203 domain-containing protein [Gemmatirosa sp.]